MNKQETEKAIGYIQNMDLSIFSDKEEACKVVDMITENLRQQLNNGWIPVTNGLPNKSGYYHITALRPEIKEEPFEEFLFYDEGKTNNWLFIADGNEEEHQRWEEIFAGKVLAWRNPAPYKEISE
jgi:hypothetical protein